MRKKANIILTGFMGTGKSTVGKKIADRLEWLFVDTDVLIEEEAEMTIPAIFAERGEPYFRALERAVITRVCLEAEKVIATGGGAIMDEENIRVLKENGTLICLTAQPEVILSRVQSNTDRPLLRGEDPLTKITMLLNARAEAYEKADFTVDTSYFTVDEVVEAICAHLRTILRT
ncbi:MAG: shikimate kinase [Candidatus Binatia bacterium]